MAAAINLLTAAAIRPDDADDWPIAIIGRSGVASHGSKAALTEGGGDERPTSTVTAVIQFRLKERNT
jgi:hypothetical protein